MKNTIYLVVVITLVLGGFYLYKSNPKETNIQVNNQEEVKVAPNDTAVSITTATKQGSYEVYSDEKISKATSGKVILFFRASWCPTCRALDSDIKSNLMNIPEGVTVLDVDYDKSSVLKQKYGVTYQHTLVQVDSKGNMIEKWSGGSTLAELLTHIK